MDTRLLDQLIYSSSANTLFVFGGVIEIPMLKSEGEFYE